jgi:glycosyltransferase involved in cell wall biosynthesis
MKICFLTRLDPYDFRSWSGTCHEMFIHLAKHHDVQWIGNKHLSFWLRALIKVQTFIEQMIGKKRGYAHFNKWHCYLKAKYVNRKLKNADFDLIFSSNSPDYIAYLNTAIPIVYSRDTTYNLFVDYYPSFFGLKEAQIKEGNEIERLAIQRSWKIIYSSEWAAASAINFYGADKDKVAIIHFGANLIYEPKEESIQLKVVEEEVCNLLFVGVNWFRKGGDVAYKTFKRLKSEGFKCRLFLVGCDVTLPEYDPDVEHIPFLNKNNRQEFDKLYEIYSQSHFLLLPTIADCTPIVFSEAAAFGIPVLTNDTGGNSSVVCEGETGYLFPAGADENIYAETIKSVFTDKELYLTLRRNSRNEFDRRLSWNVWINEVNKLIGANGASEIDERNKEKFYYEEGY